MLQRQSGSTADEWQQLRRSELTAVADRERLNAINCAVCVLGISLADLARVLTLAEQAQQGGLSIALGCIGGLQEQLVPKVADRLCAWESDLALEAKAT